MITMIQPKVVKDMGIVGTKKYYRYKLVGKELISDVVCYTLANNLSDLKEKTSSIIGEFKIRYNSVLSYKEGVDS